VVWVVWGLGLLGLVVVVVVDVALVLVRWRNAASIFPAGSFPER
jgi:hypothetical protein